MEILDLSQVLALSSRLQCCIGSNGSAKVLAFAVRLGVTHGGKRSGSVPCWSAAAMCSGVSSETDLRQSHPRSVRRWIARTCSRSPLSHPGSLRRKTEVGSSSGVLAPLLLSAIVAGCSLAPPVPEGVAPSHDEPPTGLLDGEAWWQSYNDPVLDRIVEAVLDSSFDLDAANARVKQARARAAIAGAGRWPRLVASATPQAVSAPTNTGIGAQLEGVELSDNSLGESGITLPERLDLTTYSAGLEFAYEADLWHRAGNAHGAADARQRAAEWELHAARVRVLTGTVGTYVEIVNLHRQQLISERIVEILGEWASLATLRYGAGLANARELYALRSQLAQSESELPRIEGLIVGAEGRLWVLMGGHRPDIEELLVHASLPIESTTPLPETIPTKLLLQRPDVRAARQRVEAARLDLGAHRAALLPSLSLAGSIGVASTEASNWFDPEQWVRNLSASLLAPLFDGRRLRKEAEAALARVRETVALYGRSVTTAVSEVETSLAAVRTSGMRLERLIAQEEAAGADASLAQRRYKSGVGNYSGFLAASYASLLAQSERATGERDLGYALLALHRSVGGAWRTQSDAPPAGGPPNNLDYP